MSAPNQGLRILHLTDTHLLGDGTLHYGKVDTTAALRRSLDHAGALSSLDVVVLSGDLSEDGSEASYRMLSDLIEPWALARGAVVLYAMGNHDEPGAFERMLGSREQVRVLGGFRIITLDSSVLGAGFGEIGTAQLDWLHRQLREPSTNGSIVIVHHPPVPAYTELLTALALQSPRELLGVCSDANVRLIMSGHYHHALATEVAGIPVVVAPAVANVADILGAANRERATVGTGFALIDLPAVDAHRTSFITVPGPDDGKEIFSLSVVEVQRIVREARPKG